ncbi:MAG: hypothetical protein P8Y03_19505 [Anaerolineales bacterium]|jgi:hypothetical protein
MKSDHPAEPARFGIPQGELKTFLAERGYKISELVGPSELETRYLALRGGSTGGKAPALFSLVHAVLAG